MKGFYFVDTDVRNTRAHTSQILHTVAALTTHLPLEIVTPRYAGDLDLEDIRGRQGLSAPPPIVRLPNFGFQYPGTLAFVLFNIPAIRFLMQHRTEATFIYMRSNLFLPLAIVAALFRIPRYYEAHRKPQGLGSRVCDYGISTLATGVIVISDYLRRWYEADAKQILVVHDAVSLERFGSRLGRDTARRRLDLPQSGRLCFYVGTVSKLKGCDVLIEAARELSNIMFLLVGQVLPECKEIMLPSNVHFIGRKEQSDIPTYLEAADVLLLPHPRGEYSQSPMKLFEYMASGVPIVASRLPSISEVLSDGNAILVEPGNPSALADGIRGALDDSTRARKLAEQAREDVRQYTWEARGARIYDFIRTTLI